MLASKDNFTPGEVATLRDVPVKAVLRAIRSGDLAACRYNARTIRVARPSLLAWIALCESRAMAPAISKNGSTRLNGHNSAVHSAPRAA